VANATLVESVALPETDADGTAVAVALPVGVAVALPVGVAVALPVGAAVAVPGPVVTGSGVFVPPPELQPTTATAPVITTSNAPI
jgi:hypothetical protein